MKKDADISNGLTFIFGISRLGASIASLFNEKNIDVIAIDKHETAFNKLSESFGGAQIVGDILDSDFLLENDIENAKRVIIVTEDDNVNILAAHICHSIFKIPHIYLRLNDYAKADLFKDTPIKAFFPFILSKNDLIAMLGEEK